ncbi:MAG TPA: hypothetical protein PKD81_04635 [Thiolinea sp.]|nr:hypothetical protein [Thiolinea sp.]
MLSVYSYLSMSGKPLVGLFELSEVSLLLISRRFCAALDCHREVKNACASAFVS